MMTSWKLHVLPALQQVLLVLFESLKVLAPMIWQLRHFFMALSSANPKACAGS